MVTQAEREYKTKWARRNRAKNQAKINARQRELWNERRNAWIRSQGNKCIKCGSTRRLEADHIDPTSKDARLKRNSNFWRWNKEARELELSKCQLLCQECHNIKTATNKEHARGSSTGTAKLSESQVITIIGLMKHVKNKASIARYFDVDKETIYQIAKGNTWSHIPRPK